MTKRTFPVVLYFILFISCNFSPGSYPYAEKYEIEVQESVLINAILKFKQQNHQYVVPQETGLVDGRTANGHWFYIYFYIPERDLIFLTWTRPSKKNTTSFAFASINKGLKMGNWKDINKDLNDKENSMVKDVFEKEVLSKVKQNLEPF